MNNAPHFIALLTFKTDKDGTQQTPASSGYRAGIQFSMTQSPIIGIFNFPDAELVFSGDTVTAEITLANLAFTESLYSGHDFDFFNGEILAGHGVITEVL